MLLKDLSVVPFTPELLIATKTAWVATATELDMPTLGYEQRIDWASTHIDYSSTNGKELAYAICENGSVLAMIEVVHTKRAGPDQGWLKMLEVKMGPQLAPSELESHPEKTEMLAKIYGAAIIATVKLTSQHTARVVKLYGRDKPLMSLLVGVKEALTTDLVPAEFSIRFEGRWLVISAI